MYRLRNRRSSYSSNIFLQEVFLFREEMIEEFEKRRNTKTTGVKAVHGAATEFDALHFTI